MDLKIIINTRRWPHRKAALLVVVGCLEARALLGAVEQAELLSVVSFMVTLVLGWCRVLCGPLTIYWWLPLRRAVS